MSYELEGRLFEACDCDVLCPCWVGEDPDPGVCKGTLAWHFDKGVIGGVDVSGLTLALLAYIPGNLHDGDWQVIAYVDDRASEAQEKALLDVFTGKLGGPVADLAGLVGEVVAVKRLPITYQMDRAEGTLRIGDEISVDSVRLTGAGGRTPQLVNNKLTSIPDSGNYIGKAKMYRVNAPELDIELELAGHNANQSPFRFVA